MSRSLTNDTQTKVDTALGTEPSMILKVEWEGGTAYYGEKTFTLEGWSIVGNILSFNAINSLARQDESAEISSAAVTLDDSDGTLKTAVDTEIIEGTLCTIYHHYSGLTQADLTVVLKGRISGDITWSEGERTLSFDVESIFESEQIGYAPEEGDFANLHDDAIGVAWPLCFGTPLRVPAVKIKHRTEGSLVAGINHNFTSFDVDSVVPFTQLVLTTIMVGNIKYTGIFSGKTFTVTTLNDAINTNVAFTNRPTNDANYLDTHVAWITATDTPNIVGLYCLVDHSVHGYMVNRCYKQEGRKCWFDKSWRPTDTMLEVVMAIGEVIEETAPIPRSDWPVTYTIENFGWWASAFSVIEYGYVANYSTVYQDKFTINTGASVYEAGLAFNTTYVCNLLPSTEILEVLGYRNVDSFNILTPIPSSYYTKNLSDSINGYTPTTLEFETALEDRTDEGWDGSVHVSLRSSVGPSPTNIIKYLIDTYTSLTTDTTSFTAVHASLTKYPAHFAYLDQRDAITACQEIAWQSRTAMLIANNIVKLIYLSEEHGVVLTISETETILKSMVLGFSTIEDLYTRLSATWRSDYSGRNENESKYIYSNNQDTYGLRDLTSDFYIYSSRALVVLSASFWGYRYSNSWRNITLTTTLTSLEAEHFDTLDYDIDVFSSNKIAGILEELTHDPTTHLITIKSELSSKAGDVDVGDNPDADPNYFTGDPNNPIGAANPNPTDPGDGLAEVDYIVTTEGQTDPDTDTSDTGTGDIPAYELVFIVQPTQVERGENFTVTIELQDSLGSKVSQSKSATLSLSSKSDSSDVLNTSNIWISSGSWTGSLQITGGSGSDDTGRITVAAASATSATTTTFDVIDALVDGFTWTTVPSKITRETPFSVQLDGSSGSGGKIVTIELISADPDDKLYDWFGLVTTVELDSTGEYTADDWYISGGQGSDFGTFTAIDDVDKEYDDKQSDQFTVSGLSPLTVTTNISMSQIAYNDAVYLDLTQSGTLIDDTAFTLTGTIKRSDGTTDTTKDLTMRVIAYNDANEEILFWDAAGPDANNYGYQIYANIIDGVWTSSVCKLDLSEGGITSVRIEAVCINLVGDDEYETLLRDTVYVSVYEYTFTVTSDNPLITRGAAFNITLTAMKDEEPYTSYTPSGNINFTLSGSGLDGETIAPTYTDNTGWSDGAKTVSVTISNGTGNKVVTITAED